MYQGKLFLQHQLNINNNLTICKGSHLFGYNLTNSVTSFYCQVWWKTLNFEYFVVVLNISPTNSIYPSEFSLGCFYNMSDLSHNAVKYYFPLRRILNLSIKGSTGVFFFHQSENIIQFPFSFKLLFSFPTFYFIVCS